MVISPSFLYPSHLTHPILSPPSFPIVWTWHSTILQYSYQKSTDNPIQEVFWSLSGRLASIDTMQESLRPPNKGLGPSKYVQSNVGYEISTWMEQSIVEFDWSGSRVTIVYEHEKSAQAEEMLCDTYCPVCLTSIGNIMWVHKLCLLLMDV